MTERRELLETGRDIVALESACLDERRWDEWLALFAADCEYWVPTWVTEERLADDPQSQLSQIYYSSRAGLEDRIRHRMQEPPRQVEGIECDRPVEIPDFPHSPTDPSHRIVKIDRHIRSERPRTRHDQRATHHQEIGGPALVERK